jgi:antitoxin PrlF
MKSVVGERGQVTIPKPLRENLGIRAGTELEFSEEHGRLVAYRVDKGNPFEALRGLLPRMDVDKVLEEMRGPAYSPDLDEPRHDHRRR